MAKTDKVGTHKTAIYHSDGYTCIRYHSTEVVKFNTDEIILNSGGWHTVTTKLRMNQASYQFGLGFYVHQRQFEWFVTSKDTVRMNFVTNGNRTYDFKDGMILERQSVETLERINANV